MSDNAFKNRVGPDVVCRLGLDVEDTHPAFDTEAFSRQALEGLAELELKARIDQIARTLREHLPSSYPEALEIVVATLGRPLEVEEGFGDSVFYYWIHAHFVQVFGLDHPDLSLEAL
ncbi:MAG: hypothetical protein MI919_05360, partial [Holophagales bacterium]|nr:hypothetical protein [Holophagales bacterium]